MKGSVLIIGAGPAGMRASAESLDQGFKVILVEKKPTIGGKIAQIDKMFPSNECSTCTILPRMLELTSNPNMTLVAFAEVKNIEGEAGDFKVKAVKNPKPFLFTSPFPPRKALINPEKCTYILEGKCGDKETPPCVEVCSQGLLCLTRNPQR